MTDSEHNGMQQLDFRADAETIERLFQVILGRPVGDEDFKRAHDGGYSTIYWIDRLINSGEFKARYVNMHGFVTSQKSIIPESEHRTPVLTQSAKPGLVYITGSCLTDMWPDVIMRENPGTEVRRQLFNNASELENVPSADLDKVDFQILQIPLRSIVEDSDYFSLAPSSDGRKMMQAAFDRSLERLKHNLGVSLKYNRSNRIITFVLNFPKPQSNPMGLLMPKFDLFNFSYYVEQLNAALYGLVELEDSVHVIDYDEITATLGKRFVQDDLVATINHGSLPGGSHNEHDIDLTPAGSVEDLYGVKWKELILSVFNECVSAYSILRSDDKIKLVVFDLDGTLWRGVPAELDDVGPHLTEGWPLSIVEAASYLKKRGLLLALVSKNDAELAVKMWGALYEKRFPLANFVATKFSWGSKVDSIADILRETNLLPGNVLFVDDNPVERERVQLAFPSVRMISGPIYTWRRALLWSPELQVPNITEESASRTDSTRSMMQREVNRNTLNEDQYLEQLGVAVSITQIKIDSKKFPRALELLNKTNQFNTTGIRWTQQELEAFINAGGKIVAANVSDRHSDYGLAALLLVRNGECTQLVMSCRVFGLRVEFALIQYFLNGEKIARRLLFRETDKNGLCRDFISKIGLAPLQTDSSVPQTLEFSDDYAFDQNLMSKMEVSIVD